MGSEMCIRDRPWDRLNQSGNVLDTNLRPARKLDYKSILTWLVLCSKVVALDTLVVRLAPMSKRLDTLRSNRVSFDIRVAILVLIVGNI